jgi:hypothetical protein
MKFNVSPKEFLSLYNLLHVRLLDRTIPVDTFQQEVYNRMKAWIIASLTSKGDAANPADLWFEQQEAKIENLRKKSVQEYIDEGSVQPCQTIMSDDDDTGAAPRNYPKKPPAPIVPKHNRSHHKIIHRGGTEF